MGTINHDNNEQSKRIFFFSVSVCCFFAGVDQFIVQVQLSKSEFLQSYSWRAMGPVNMGGRVTDIDGIPGYLSTFYVCGADGGVHKTTDGGVSFTPIF